MAVFDEITCYKCAIVFGVPLGHRERLMESTASFFCPNGHSQAYKESTTDKLRRERDRLKQQLSQKDDEILRAQIDRKEAERVAKAAKAKIARLAKRAAAGLCPCCNRHFTDLQRHMASKHKEPKQWEVKHEVKKDTALN